MRRPPTDRQREAWALLGDGLARPAVADLLGISLPTLKHLLYSHDHDGRGSRYIGLYERIGARNRTHAAVLWREHGQHQQPTREE